MVLPAEMKPPKDDGDELEERIRYLIGLMLRHGMGCGELEWTYCDLVEEETVYVCVCPQKVEPCVFDQPVKEGVCLYDDCNFDLDELAESEHVKNVSFHNGVTSSPWGGDEFHGPHLGVTVCSVPREIVFLIFAYPVYESVAGTDPVKDNN